MTGHGLLVQKKPESKFEHLVSAWTHAGVRRNLTRAKCVLTRRPTSGTYLLCRPRGGLNDTLCRIAKCIRYATQHQRKLIIDTERSGLRACFSEYFCLAEPSSAIVLQLDQQMRQTLVGMETVYPPCLEKRWLDYEASFLQSKQRVVLESTDLPLAFNFRSKYDSRLLVYEQSGGGRASLRALPYLRFQPRITHAIQTRLAALPDSYVAVHVRHTDMRLDYRAMFTAMRALVEGQDLVVCTDSLEVLEYAESYFPNTRVFCLAQLDPGNLPLHDRPGFTSRESNIDSLTDLVALASAEVLVTGCNWRKRHYSGFSYLAASLHRRPGLLQSLLLT